MSVWSGGPYTQCGSLSVFHMLGKERVRACFVCTMVIGMCQWDMVLVRGVLVRTCCLKHGAGQLVLLDARKSTAL